MRSGTVNISQGSSLSPEYERAAVWDPPATIKTARVAALVIPEDPGPYFAPAFQADDPEEQLQSACVLSDHRTFKCNCAEERSRGFHLTYLNPADCTSIATAKAVINWKQLEYAGRLSRHKVRLSFDTCRFYRHNELESNPDYSLSAWFFEFHCFLDDWPDICWIKFSDVNRSVIAETAAWRELGPVRS
ncbi:MAG TPA: hypothetical protein VK670_05810 [Silvibacterium sp.]|nr:hypothetical protein [Silvibacterium sp.]